MQLVIGFLVGFLPQIILWKYFYNTFWLSPYFGTGFNLLKPQVIYVLFNTQNGLFTITPIVGISFLGLFLLKRRFYTKNTLICIKNNIFGDHNLLRELQTRVRGVYPLYSYLLIYFLLQLYLVSSWGAYFQGGSYSIRMLITTYPLLSFGLASSVEKFINKFGEIFTILAVFFFSLLNSLLIINYLLRF